jgi:hypothetical protein
MGRYQDLQRNKTKTLQEVRTLIRSSKLISEASNKTIKDAFVGPVIEFIENEWSAMGAKLRTAVLETIPLLFALNPKISSPADIVTLIDSDYDWNSDAVDWFKSFLKKLDTVNKKNVEKQEKILRGYIKVSASGRSKTKYNDDGEYEDFFYNKQISTLKNFGFDYFANHKCRKSVLGGGSSLNDINGTFDRFIHGNIGEFYKNFNRGIVKSGGEQISKTFTADIVLIYGNASVNDIVSNQKLSKNYKVIPEELSVELTDGTKLIFVSLKAEGRLGKVGNIETVIDKYAQELSQELSGNKSKVKQKSKKEQVEESSTRIRESVIPLTEEAFFSSIAKAIKDTAKDLTKKGLEKVESYWEKAKDWFNGWVQSLKKIVDDFIGFAQEEQNKQDKAIKTVQEMVKQLESGGGTNETKGSMSEPAEINYCFKQKLKFVAEQIGATTDGDFTKITQKMTSLGEMSNKYKDDKIFRIVFPQYGTTDANKRLVTTPGIIEDMKKTYFEIVNAEEVRKPKNSQDCPAIKLRKNITKDEVKNFLWQYVNVNTIPVLEHFVKDVYEKAISSYSETEDVRAMMIKFCVEMNTEAVFGNSGDLPLVKYDTGKILRLGVRDEFIEKKKQRLLQAFKSETAPPVIAIKITQTEARNLHGEPYAFFQIKLFILSDVEVNDTSVNEIPNDAFIYGVATFKNNKGSQFVFVKEVDQEIDGDSLITTLSSKDA